MVSSSSSSSFSSVTVSARKRKRKRERKYWNEEESRILREYIERNGEGKWEQVAINTGLREAGRSGNSCWGHWFNQLKPGIEKGPFTAEEDAKIIHLHNNYHGGNKKWPNIATHLPGRTDNQVKNRWNTKLSKDVGEQLLFEYANAPDFNQDVDVGDQQLLFEYTNAPDFNQFSLSDQIYNYDFSEFDLEMNSL